MTKLEELRNSIIERLNEWSYKTDWKWNKYDKSFTSVNYRMLVYVGNLNMNDIPLQLAHDITKYFLMLEEE